MHWSREVSQPGSFVAFRMEKLNDWTAFSVSDSLITNSHSSGTPQSKIKTLPILQVTILLACTQSMHVVHHQPRWRHLLVRWRRGRWGWASRSRLIWTVFVCERTTLSKQYMQKAFSAWMIHEKPPLVWFPLFRPTNQWCVLTEQQHRCWYWNELEIWAIANATQTSTTTFQVKSST
jgi:hypothetical protein